LYENVKLLHSRFIWKDRIEKEQQIQKDYKHTEGVIWVTTQLVEASLDIDFDVLFTEIAPADSLIQRMGRVHRHKKHDYLGDYNVYIYTEVDEKKTSRIYEKVLRDKSIELVKENLDKEDYLSSYSKRKIVETLYSEEFLKRINSKYIEKWKEVEEILDSEWENLLVKTAQEMFRNIFTIEVVPYMFKEIVQGLEKDYYNTKKINDEQKRKIERVGILKQINDYKVPIPLYWWLSQNKSKFEYYSRLGIKILGKEFEYDSDLGIIINKETLQNSYVDEDIFI
jgi:CRISPR-associated endonuclease/helicase Cas3